MAQPFIFLKCSQIALKSLNQFDNYVEQSMVGTSNEQKPMTTNDNGCRLLFAAFTEFTI